MAKYRKGVVRQGLAGAHGTGKLHHHLGLPSREVDNEELRAVYRFVKRFYDFPQSYLKYY